MPDSTDPSEWLRYARSDFALAEAAPPSGVLLVHLCFHAQQAAEKALKAVLLAHGARVIKTHDVNFLVDLVQQAGAPAPPLSRVDAESLTSYSVITRYPADLGEVDEAEWQRAVGDAARVLAWADGEIGRP